MGCACAVYDPDTGGYNCEVSGDGCMFMRPNSKACAEQFGEGPDAFPDDKCENCQGFVLIDGLRHCQSTWGRCMMSCEDLGTHYDVVPIDEDTVSCGGFKKREEGQEG